jgi:2-polyprenyl-6-methoxyphenol hydroxylase-like FAD-dependent oxidoreductase
MKALIIGGGIGGLVTALALRRAGIDAVVFEQAPVLRENGAGLTLWSNAMRALDTLGLSEPLLAAGTRLECGEIRSHTGRRLASFRLDRLAERCGAPIIGIPRADLLAILARAVPSADVRLNARLVRLSQNEGGVTACFADGREEWGDLLIGADGIHSRVRELMTGDAKRYCGYIGWQGVAPIRHPDFPPGLSLWSYGRGAQFGLIPVGGGRVFWFGTTTLPEDQIASLGPHQEELRARFGAWHTPIREALEAVDEKALVCVPIYDRPPVRRWGVGRLTLVGDAAHATSPTLGQGACLAIESAAALAHTLQREPSIETALRHYERVRQRRTARIIDQAWRIGSAIQWQNPLACALRDEVVRCTPSALHECWLKRIVATGRAEVLQAGR